MSTQSLQKQIPDFPAIEASAIETHYNPPADTLVVYFRVDHHPTYWSEIDDYLLLGRKIGTEEITGVMIEYFSEWLLMATDMAQKAKALVTA
jgi:hypothetical protein